MAEIVKLAVGDIGARGRQRLAGLPRHLHRKHPVEPAVHEIDRQAAQSFRVGHLRHQRMEGGGDRRQMGEGRSALQPGDVAERAAVAHPGQQQSCGIDVPAASHRIEDAGEVRRVGVFPHQAQVLPVAVGATRMAPKLRASRSQLHRKPRPLPLPPCSAITSGQARSGV